MVKILFDLLATQPIGVSKFHGGGEYAKTIFWEVLRQTTDNEQLEVFWNYSNSIDDTIKKACEDNSIRVHNCTSDTDINELLKKENYDVFYSALPYAYGKLIVPPQTRFIYTIHGLRCMEMPTDSIKYGYSSNELKGVIKCILEKIFPSYRLREFTQQKNNVEHLLHCTQNQMIITDSEHSKYSILNFFSYVPKDSIRVYYAPAKAQKSKTSTMLIEKYNLQKNDYILMVSGNRWEKNALRGALAMDRLFSSHDPLLPNDLKVVITGVKDQNVFLRKLENKKKFVFLEYVDSAELDALYQHSHLLLYPSLNEGFGYPPIEAMEYGTLCCCSAIASIPEICGDAVIYFNPFDINEIKNRVLQSFDKNIEKEYQQRITKQKEKVANKQHESLYQLAQTILLKNLRV